MTKYSPEDYRRAAQVVRAHVRTCEFGQPGPDDCCAPHDIAADLCEREAERLSQEQPCDACEICPCVQVARVEDSAVLTKSSGEYMNTERYRVVNMTPKKTTAELVRGDLVSIRPSVKKQYASGRVGVISATYAHGVLVEVRLVDFAGRGLGYVIAPREVLEHETHPDWERAAGLKP